MRFGRLAMSCVPLALAVAATLSAACSTTANVSDIYLALDGNGDRKRDSFFTDTKEIFCIAEVGSGRKDLTVEAYMRLIGVYENSDELTPKDEYFAYTEFTPGQTQGQPAKLSLSMAPRDEKGKTDETKPQTAGRYSCEFYLDGKLARSVDFDVDYAECPATVIVPGTPCAGFFKTRTKCRQFGDKSTENKECSCETAGWDCE